MDSDQRSPANSGFSADRPSIIALLYLASFLVGITWLIAGVLAFVWKGETHAAWEDSHYAFHINTLWMGIVLGFVGFVVTMLTLGVAGFIVFPLLAIWFAVRNIKALLASQKAQPISAPGTWLF